MTRRAISARPYSAAPEATSKDRAVAANAQYLITYMAANLGEGAAWGAFGEDAAVAATAAGRVAGRGLHSSTSQLN